MRLLDIGSAVETRPWIGRLVEWRIAETKGRTKGMRYLVHASLLRQLDFQSRTTLKAIEPHRLRELVLSDLARYPNSSLGEIQARVGNEIPKRTLQRALSGLIASGAIRSHGRLRGTKYKCAT